MLMRVMWWSNQDAIVQVAAFSQALIEALYVTFVGFLEKESVAELGGVCELKFCLKKYGPSKKT